MRSFKKDIVQHFSVQDRLARGGFLWRSFLCSLVFLIGLGLSHTALLGYFVGAPLAFAFVMFAVALTVYALVWDICLHVRRLNDINRSGWWSVMTFFKPLSWMLTVLLVLWPGTHGHNRFGAAPA